MVTEHNDIVWKMFWSLYTATVTMIDCVDVHRKKNGELVEMYMYSGPFIKSQTINKLNVFLF